MAKEIRKKVKNAVLYTDGSIKLIGVRFSYPHLAKAYKGDDEKAEAKFGIVGMLPKTSHKAAKELCMERIDELMKENKVKALPADKKFLRDGDEHTKDEYDEHWIVSARETKRPPLRDRQNAVVEPEDAAEVFRPGYWGDILIRPWYQNNKYGKRVNAGLSSVQFVKKDEEFGEGGISDEDLDDAFENYGDDDDDSYDEDDAPARKPKKKPRKPVDDDEDEYDDDI